MNAETAAHLARTVGKKASFAYLNGGSYTFEFLAPDVLLNMNDRTHWRKKAQQVKNWRTATSYAAGQQIGITLPPCWVHLTLPVRDSRRRDPMNYAPTLKACVDGMVDAGLWVDDTPEYVTCVEPKLEKRTLRWVTVELVPR